MRSLRRTLLVTLLAAVASVTLAAAFLVYGLARREIDALLDYHLRQMALSLRDRVPDRAGAIGSGGVDLDFVIQIWDEDGLRLYVSRPGSGLPELAELGFATVPSPSGPWRVYSVDAGGLVVQVAQPERVRRELAFAAVSRTLAPVALILPLLALLVWWTVGRTLAPLERLARSVAARSAAALESIPEGAAPAEALPLVRSLNDLLARLRAALSAQRAFVADAAHALRTPLAALELQAQGRGQKGRPLRGYQKLARDLAPPSAACAAMLAGRTIRHGPPRLGAARRRSEEVRHGRRSQGDEPAGVDGDLRSWPPRRPGGRRVAVLRRA